MRIRQLVVLAAAMVIATVLVGVAVTTRDGGVSTPRPSGKGDAGSGKQAPADDDSVGSLLRRKRDVERHTPSPPFTPDSSGGDAADVAQQWATNIRAAEEPSQRGHGAVPTPTTEYLARMEDVVDKYLQQQLHQSEKAAATGAGAPNRPFRFHVYDIPRRYIEGAIDELEARWSTSFCNRHSVKTNYTMLDWRHAHSLFTVDVFMAKYLRYHPSHTADPALADVFIIPMMTHVYNCAGLMKYTIEILSWVVQFPYYRIYNNHDHFLFWWRWGMHYNSVLRFWKRVQTYLPNVNIISYDLLEIMGRNEFQDFSLALKPKFHQNMLNVIVPYPDYSPPFLPGNLPQTWEDQAADNAKPNARNIFFYFAGTSTIGGIRRWIKRACENNTADCVFQDFGGSVVDPRRLGVPKEYPAAMKRSIFCGHAAGDALSSRRPTSAVLAGCIPVLICDLCLYAWENLIDYGRFAVFVSEDDVMAGNLWSILHSIPAQRIANMQRELFRVRPHFLYHTDGPPQQGDALDMLVRELQLRGALLRSYRRWFAFNHRLSSNARDYPPDPPVVKRYLGRGSTAKEARDFNNLRG